MYFSDSTEVVCGLEVQNVTSTTPAHPVVSTNTLNSGTESFNADKGENHLVV